MSIHKIHNSIGIAKKTAFLLFLLLQSTPFVAAVDQNAVDDMNNRLDAGLPGQFQLNDGKIIFTGGNPPLWAIDRILDYLGGVKGYGTGGINPFKFYTHDEWTNTAIYYYSMSARNMLDTWDENIGLETSSYGVDIIAEDILKLGPSVYKDLHEYQLKMAERAEWFGNLIPLIIATLKDWKVATIVFFGVLLLIGLPMVVWNATKALFKYMMVRRPDVIGCEDTDIYKSWWSRWAHKNRKIPRLVVDTSLGKRLNGLINDNRRIARLREQKKYHPYAHILAYGPPGTGKTLFAKTLSRKSDQSFISTTMSDFAQLPEEQALAQFKDVLKFAKANGPVLLIIDEFDIMFDETDLKMKKMRVLLQKYFSDATNYQVQLFCITNYKHKIPLPILSRLQERLEFSNPGLATLKKQMVIHLTRCLKSTKIARELTSLVPDDLLEGLNGRGVQFIAARYALRVGKKIDHDRLEAIIRQVRVDLEEEKKAKIKKVVKEEKPVKKVKSLW